MKNKQLFVVDLDGTTLINQETINKDFVVSAKKAISQGHIVAIATGRSYGASIRFYNEIGLSTLLINCNGNHIKHPLKKDSPRLINTFPSKIIKDLVENPHFTKHIGNYILETTNYIKSTKYIKEKLELWYTSHPLKIVDIKEKIKDEEILTSMIFVDRNGFKEVYDYLLQNKEISIYVIDILSNNFMIIEIFSSQGSKGKAVRILQKEHNINNKNTHVFGDSNNDIPMFSIGVNSYAVNNAINDLKDIATKVMDKSNIDNAVGIEIERIIKNLK